MHDPTPALPVEPTGECLCTQQHSAEVEEPEPNNSTSSIGGREGVR